MSARRQQPDATRGAHPHRVRRADVRRVDVRSPHARWTPRVPRLDSKHRRGAHARSLGARRRLGDVRRMGGRSARRRVDGPQGRTQTRLARTSASPFAPPSMNLSSPRCPRASLRSGLDLSAWGGPTRPTPWSSGRSGSARPTASSTCTRSTAAASAPSPRECARRSPASARGSSRSRTSSSCSIRARASCTRSLASRSSMRIGRPARIRIDSRSGSSARRRCCASSSRRSGTSARSRR